MSVDSPARPDRRDVVERLGFLASLIIGSCLTWLRLPPGTGDGIWGEDGIIFLGGWATQPSPWLLFEPYAGYQHFIPRVASALVVAVAPVGAYGWAVTILSCVLVGAVSALTYRLSRSVTASHWARAGLAGIPVLLPLAGQEPLGNLANIHWYAMYLMPWVLLADPRSTRGRIGTALLAFALAATEPQTLFFLPLALVRAWPSPRVRIVTCGYALGLAAQTATYLLTERPRIPGTPPVMSTVDGYLANVSLSIFTGGAVDTGTTVADLGWWIGYVSLSVFLVAAIVAFRLGTGIVKLAVVSLLVGSAASWIASFVLNNWPPAYYSELSSEQLAAASLFRWGTSAGMLLAAVVPVLAGVLIQRGGRAGRAAPALVVLLLGVMALTFQNPDSIRGKNAPTWTEEMENATRGCSASPQSDVAMRTSPDSWIITLPCRLVLD